MQTLFVSEHLPKLFGQMGAMGASITTSNSNTCFRISGRACLSSGS